MFAVLGSDPIEHAAWLDVKFGSMPTVLRIGPFFFVSLDCGEPPHIHVRRENMVAKFWLDPVEEVDKRTGTEKTQVEVIVAEGIASKFQPFNLIFVSNNVNDSC
jgi:hypothetical protein